MKIEMILYDMDGTLVQYRVEPHFSSWDALPLAFSDRKRKQWTELSDKCIDKPESYNKWFSEQVRLLKGLKICEAEKVLFPIPYSKGVEDSFKDLDGNYIKGIVSHGIDIVARKICEEQRMNFFVSNMLNVKEGVFDGTGKMLYKLDDKLNAVEKISEDYCIPFEKICFVGDNFNDIPVLKKVGLPVSFNPKSEDVKENSRFVIHDFRKLNLILKYK